MPILLDISQICIGNLMMSPDIRKTGEVDANLVKHMILNSIRAYKHKFKSEYGDIVVCCDSRHYWRKDVFPHYKAGRGKGREDSPIDWQEVFKTINQTKEDLKEFFPYKVIQVEGAEADDVIGVISKYHGERNEPVMIVSSDADYNQLQKYISVAQWSPNKKKVIVIGDPRKALIEKVITGDSGDGIPNIKSASNSFVDGIRQSSIFKKDLEKWVDMEPEHFCSNKTMLENYHRNNMLINFEFIPQNISSEILVEYEKEPVGNKAKMRNYFMANKMRNLMQDLDQF